MKEKYTVYGILLLGSISIIAITLLQMGNILNFYVSNLIREGIVFAMLLFAGILYTTARKKTEAIVFYIFALIIGILFVLSI